MSAQDSSPNLPGFPNHWYHLVRPSRGIQRIVVGSSDTAVLARQCAELYGTMSSGWTIAVHHHGPQEVAPEGSWHESFLVLPSSAGARALLSIESNAAFRLGVPLLPGGRKRIRLLRACLNLPGIPQLLSRQKRERITFITKPENPDDQSALHDMRTPVAVCEGVPGPLRKVVVTTRDANGDRFFKVACTPFAVKSIRNETHTLAALKESDLAPALLVRDSANPPKWFAQEGLSGVRAKANLNTAVLSWLTSIAARGHERRPIRKVLAELSCNKGTALLHQDFRTLSDTLKSHFAGTHLPCTPCHGDFTPWNTRVHGDKLTAFDWEFYKESAPALFDLFHFELQTGVLMRKVPAENAMERVLQLVRDRGYTLCRVAGVQDHEIDTLAAIYVLAIADRDATLHSIHRPQFEQVQWLESARRLWARQLTERLGADPAILPRAA